VAAWNTGIAASLAGIAWCLLDYRHHRKYSMVGFCSGTIVGLVASTPSSGMIPPWASLILGIVAGVGCNYATKIKHWIRIDDTLDLFVQHGVAGVIGLLFNGVFAADYIISLDGVSVSIPGGLMQRNFKQPFVQFIYVALVAAYVFTVTALICKAMDLVPGLKLRGSDEAETVGMDEYDIGEFVQDFVEARKAFDDWNPPRLHGSRGGGHTVDGQDEIVAAGDRHGRCTDIHPDDSLSRRCMQCHSETRTTINEAVTSEKYNQGMLTDVVPEAAYSAKDLDGRRSASQEHD